MGQNKLDIFKFKSTSCFYFLEASFGVIALWGTIMNFSVKFISLNGPRTRQGGGPRRVVGENLPIKISLTPKSVVHLKFITKKW